MTDTVENAAPHSANVSVAFIGVGAAAILGIVIAVSTTFIGMNARVSVLENNQVDQRSFYSETRGALDKISGQIADLRVMYATPKTK